jgi:LemA protein
MVTIVIIVVFVAAAAVTAAVLHVLVSRRTHARDAWSQIEAALERRHDIVPDLVHAMQASAAHESRTLPAVTAARAAAITAGAGARHAAVIGSELTLARTVRALLAVAESCPALRTQRQFQALREEFTAAEDAVEAARLSYNADVRAYNASVAVLPTRLAAALGFRAAALFPGDENGHPASVAELATGGAG